MNTTVLNSLQSISGGITCLFGFFGLTFFEFTAWPTMAVGAVMVIEAALYRIHLTIKEQS